MQVYSDSITKFASALEVGKWHTSNSWKQRIYYLLSGETRYYQNITHFFLNQVDAFERQPFDFTGKCLTEQKVAVLAFVRSANFLQSKIEKNIPFTTLLQRVCALKYRAEGIHGGLDKKSDVSEEIYNQLSRHLLDWKKSRLFYNEGQNELSNSDQRALNEICLYQEFALLILQSETLREKLFDWSIKDNNQPSIFIEFPSISERIESVSLSKRIGRFAGKILQMHKGDLKTCTMLFQVEESDKSLKSRHFSLLDESQEFFVRGGSKWSIQTIFDEHFAKKDDKIGDFEVFGGDSPEEGGILCWNAHELGHFDTTLNDYARLDLENEEWWQKLPIFETVEPEELEKRTGLKIKENTPWGVVMAKASRQNPNLNIEGCHGFLGLAILREDRRYQLLDFGKYPAKFPLSKVEKLFFLAATVIAKIEYPDTNNFYSERQIAVFAKELNKDTGENILKLVAADLKMARKNHLIFQFGWDNCAYWPQELFNKVFNAGNLFYMSLLRIEAEQPFLKFLIRIGNSLPKKLQSTWVSFLLWILGYKKGVVIGGTNKCLRDTPLVTDQSNALHFPCPAYLHKQIEEKQITGVIL